MICVRAIHFAATITVAGVVFFIVFVAEPAFGRAGNATRARASVRRVFAWIAWIALPLTIVSGAAWLVLVAQSMSGQTLTEIFSEDTLWLVLSRTGFGRDWVARFVLAGVLGGVFVPFFSERGRKDVGIKLVVVASAAGLVGSLVWAGHAAGGSGLEAILHPASDFLHLVAAAAWVGTLIPLALLLAALGHDAGSLAIAGAATTRFSTFGIGGVATLLVTGTINTWYLAGSIPALTETDYGRILLVKIALFLAMVAVAAVNRLRLTPRLVGEASPVAGQTALRQLRRNTVIEVAVGAVIIAIVAVLGTNPPGLEALTHAHHHAH
jgi:copper resistance protein D